MLVAPPVDARPIPARFPEGDRVFPPALLRALRDWHERRGVPKVHLNQVLNEKSKVTGWACVREPLPSERCTFGAGVIDAYYRYRTALQAIAASRSEADRDGSYSRLPEVVCGSELRPGAGEERP